ncbi:MAG: sugar phosphorylase [Chloroflexi bacterium]|nr:sugar phosphorylase [Chloroflexota bacterium]
MTIEERIRYHIAFLYGEKKTDQIWNELHTILDEFQKRAAQNPIPAVGLDERDAILIMYGDSIQTPGQPSLEVLKEFVETYILDSVSGIHILPFYPYSSDDGFSVIDFRQVDPSLGGWDDVIALGKNHRLMFDAVINHISRKSAWFQSYLRGESPYRDYFIIPPDDWDLSNVVRPRTLPLLTEVETSDGLRRVWTTFSDDQMDLNYGNPQILLEIVALMLFYVEKGASILRLDAIAYLWKESGSSCIHLPQTHAVIKILRAVLDLVSPQVLLITETNVPHEKNISYFGDPLPETDRTDEAQLVYQFPLAPLILHTFASADAGKLSKWAASLDGCGMFFNFIASHDGIGVLPAQGILSENEIQSLVARTLANGGRVSYKSNPDGTQSPYELNITLYDALNNPAYQEPSRDIDRFIASQAIMLSLAGVPGIYIHSLFGSRNCQDCVGETGQSRSINRQKFDFATLKRILSQPDSRESRVLNSYLRLLNIRREQPAFHPLASQEITSNDASVFSILRRSLDGKQAVLCLTNVTPVACQFHLALPFNQLPFNSAWRDLIDGQGYLAAQSSLDVFLKPYQSCWLSTVNAGS